MIWDKYETEYKKFVRNGKRGAFIVDNAPDSLDANYKYTNKVYNDLFAKWEKEVKNE